MMNELKVAMKFCNKFFCSFFFISKLVEAVNRENSKSVGKTPSILYRFRLVCLFGVHRPVCKIFQKRLEKLFILIVSHWGEPLNDTRKQ